MQGYNVEQCKVASLLNTFMLLLSKQELIVNIVLSFSFTSFKFSPGSPDLLCCWELVPGLEGRVATDPHVLHHTIFSLEVLSTTTDVIITHALKGLAHVHPPFVLLHVLVLGEGLVTLFADEGSLPLVAHMLVLDQHLFAPAAEDAALESTQMVLITIFRF